LGLYILGIGPKISPFFAYNCSILVIEPKKKLQKKKKDKKFGVAKTTPNGGLGVVSTTSLVPLATPNFLSFFKK
jgi:hypothetical protein